MRRTPRHILAGKWLLAYALWFSNFLIWNLGWTDSFTPHQAEGNCLLIMLILITLAVIIQAGC